MAFGSRSHPIRRCVPGYNACRRRTNGAPFMFCPRTGTKVGLAEVQYGSGGVKLVERGMGLPVEKPSGHIVLLEHCPSLGSVAPSEGPDTLQQGLISAALGGLIPWGTARPEFFNKQGGYGNVAVGSSA